jgi:imidazole glycerol-phosphate synthase subunit HisF
VLKTRVIPTLLYRNHTLVKGRGFDSWRTVGAVMQAVRVYSLREVDELIFLDIAATAESRPPWFDVVREMAAACFMPLTVGGGVRRLADVHRLLEVGADKVAINTAAVELPGLLEEAASAFGSQCMVVSIDVRRIGAQDRVVIRSGTEPTGLDPVDFARDVAARGAGEILLTSVERDGTMQGYDAPLIRRVADAVSIPVIAAGGAGTYAHMLEALREGGAVAVAAASMFHFTEQTPQDAKRFLRGHGVPVRADPPTGLFA